MGDGPALSHTGIQGLVGAHAGCQAGFPLPRLLGSCTTGQDDSNCICFLSGPHCQSQTQTVSLEKFPGPKGWRRLWELPNFSQPVLICEDGRPGKNLWTSPSQSPVPETPETLGAKLVFSASFVLDTGTAF